MADPLGFDYERVLANVRKATTADLLDRITFFRGGMEPEAVTMIKAELADRGVTVAQIAEHAAQFVEGIVFPDGTPARCTHCGGPAVAQGWGWHRLFNKVPVFPRYLYYCRAHSSERKN